MRGGDWWEVAISVAVVTVWLGVATLADRAAPDRAPLPAPPASVGATTNPPAPARS